MSYQYTDTSKTAVRDTNTGATTPLDEKNRRYRNEVKPWIDAGNTPEPAEPETTIAQLWTAMRRERDARLAATDQWGLVDYRNQHDAATVAAWDTYRQALRNLPDNTTDPRYVFWPTKPS